MYATLYALQALLWLAGAAVEQLRGAAWSLALWLFYYHHVKGQGERHIADAVGGRRLCLWAYGHVPLYMGIGSLAAGTVALSAPGALTPASGALYMGGLALAVVELSLLSLAGQNSEHS